MPARQGGQQVACLELEKYAHAARFREPDGVVKRRCFSDADRVVVTLQSCGPLERQRPAAGTGRHDHGLSGAELAGDGLAKWRSTVGGADDVNQLGVPQRFVNVVSGADDGRKSLQIATGMDTALLGNCRDVVGERRKVEYPHVMAMSATIEGDGRATGAGPEDCDFHYWSVRVIVSLEAP